MFPSKAAGTLYICHILMSEIIYQGSDCKYVRTLVYQLSINKLSLQLVSMLNLIQANWPIKVKSHGQILSGESCFENKGLHTAMKWAVRD